MPVIEFPYSIARQNGGNIWWHNKIGSLLLKFDNKAGPGNQGRPLLNVTFTLCSIEPSPFYKGEPSDLGLNNLIYVWLEIHVNILTGLLLWYR